MVKSALNYGQKQWSNQSYLCCWDVIIGRLLAKGISSYKDVNSLWGVSEQHEMTCPAKN